ncbi:MAG: hypothetical protein LQ348_000460 [Seirophora lacunosa]|nr:MAG: hypothetical protein LQ348_000460 [Seirophora lacunosa]
MAHMVCVEIHNLPGNVPSRTKANAVLASREYFKNTRAPFGVTVAGQTLYVVTSLEYVPVIYRNTSTLTFDDFVRDMMLSVGASEDGVQKMWESPRYDNSGTQRLHKVLAHAGEDYYRQKFHPGDHLGDLWMNIQQRIEQNMKWDNISPHCTIQEPFGKNEKTLSLLLWCQSTLLSSVTNAVFGPKLLQLEPALLRSFVTFDDNSWKLTYKLPRFIAQEVYDGKDHIISAFKKYFALPASEREGRSWVVQMLESEMRGIGVREQDMAALFVMPFWVINSNAYKLCFWMMAYLVHYPSLHEAIRKEALSNFAEGFAGFEHRIEHCSRMTALYNEMLRYTTASASIRTVAEPTDLGPYTLSAGSKVLIPYRQLHFDPTHFGGNAAEFDMARFFGDHELSKHGAFRPFGGGTTYCAGRHVARREVLAFVAMALKGFDISLAGAEHGMDPQMLPVCDVKKPSLGVLPPMPGQDVKVVIKQRAA